MIMKWNDTLVKLNEVKLFPPFMIPTYLNFLIPQTPKMCDSVLVTLMKMQPHPAAHPHTARVLSRTGIWGVEAFPPPKKNTKLSPQNIVSIWVTVSEKSSSRNEVSSHIVTFLKIVSQNAPDCVSVHIHCQKFSGGVCPRTPLGSSSPSATRDFSTK